MRALKNKPKKIVYWGMGIICNYCLEQHPEVIPLFIIDSYLTYCNEEYELKKPEDIVDWSQYYIIITVKSNRAKTQIQNYLTEKGLHKGENFCTYEDFFECKRPTTVESINLVSTYISEYPETINSVMFQVPLFDVRNYKVFIKFMSSYIRKKEYNKSVLFSNLKVTSAELASKKLNCPVFYAPDTFDLEITNQIRDNISKEDYNWLEMLEFRKAADVKEKEINTSLKLFYYYKKIIETIKPSKIIIWGHWNKESYILGYLADFYNIPHGYMEHGWIPGTYQVDPRGIAGQSEYAVNPGMFDEIKIESVYNIEQIKKYVRKSKLDTTTFIHTEEDNTALLRIDKNRKTVFLVGLGEKGLQINPKSNYWKEYVSSVVESTKEVLILLIELCKKNNWNLIFKPHPGDSVPELKQGLEDVIIVRSMEIDHLIGLADVVVSIASAVDYKVLIYGKPLVQLGITGLLGKNCTYIVSKKEMLEEQIILALKNGMTKEQTENYNHMLQILLQKYLWDDMSERSLRYGLSLEHEFLE